MNALNLQKQELVSCGLVKCPNLFNLTKNEQWVPHSPVPTSTTKVAIDITIKVASNTVNVGILATITRPSVRGGGSLCLSGAGRSSKLPAIATVAEPFTWRKVNNDQHTPTNPSSIHDLILISFRCLWTMS